MDPACGLRHVYGGNIVAPISMRPLSTHEMPIIGSLIRRLSIAVGVTYGFGIALLPDGGVALPRLEQGVRSLKMRFLSPSESPLSRLSSDMCG